MGRVEGVVRCDETRVVKTQTCCCCSGAALTAAAPSAETACQPVPARILIPYSPPHHSRAFRRIRGLSVGEPAVSVGGAPRRESMDQGRRACGCVRALSRQKREPGPLIKIGRKGEAQARSKQVWRRRAGPVARAPAAVIGERALRAGRLGPSARHKRGGCGTGAGVP